LVWVGEDRVGVERDRRREEGRVLPEKVGNRYRRLQAGDEGPRIRGQGLDEVGQVAHEGRGESLAALAHAVAPCDVHVGDSRLVPNQYAPDPAVLRGAVGQGHVRGGASERLQVRGERAGRYRRTGGSRDGRDDVDLLALDEVCEVGLSGVQDAHVHLQRRGRRGGRAVETGYLSDVGRS